MLQLGPVKQSLAVVALLFLLLRPLCDVWAAGHGDAQSGPAAQPSAWQDDRGVAPHDGGSCCATIEGGTLAKPSEAGAIAIGTHGQAAIAAAAWNPAAYGGVAMAATRKPPGVSLPTLSYYARSARIQR